MVLKTLLANDYMFVSECYTKYSKCRLCNLAIAKLQFSIIADTFSDQMSKILTNYGMGKIYFLNLQNKTSCCKNNNFLKTEQNKNNTINNETTFLNKALQSQVYFKFVVVIV